MATKSIPSDKKFMTAGPIEIAPNYVIERAEAEDSEPSDDLTPNVALIMARSLPDIYIENRILKLRREIGYSPEFYKMVTDLSTGKMDLWHFATHCYTAGRLSVAFSPEG